jgi:NADH-quinone oxidoreductase subunit C
MKIILLLLPLAALVSAARYDPDADRQTLIRQARASHKAAADAAARPLEPGKIKDIDADLDESAEDARLAAEAAKSLESEAVKRAAEMDAALKGKDEEADATARAAAALRARLKAISIGIDEQRARVGNMPDQTPDGKPNEAKARLSALLDRAAAALATADQAVTAAETAASQAGLDAGRMSETRRRSGGPAGERATAVGQALKAQGELPPLVAAAKAAVALIGQEPQNVNRTRAGEALLDPREAARKLLDAADRACNRADDFRRESDRFDKAKAAYEQAREDAQRRLGEAKEPLENADEALSRARSSSK